MSAGTEPRESQIFLIRLWQEVDAEGHSHWRGRVEHVASQEVGYVEDAAGVARFVERWTGAQAAAQNVTTG